MKVLLVNGSPHKNGSTNRALQEVEKTLQAAGVETEIFWIGNEPIGGCIGCGGCGKTGACVFGGVVAEFTEKAKTADGFVFGSPVHYAAASGNMTSFLDRVFYSADAETFRFKPAAVVTAARRGGNSAAYEQLLKYPGISHMPIVSSQYWNMVHGANAQDVEQDLEGLQTMRALGRNMTWLLSCIEAGKDAGINPPAVEPFQRTNFIR
ncbi:MAG: flavodoxin family protein [Oscillospiraceae bacterium]